MFDIYSVSGYYHSVALFFLFPARTFQSKIEQDLSSNSKYFSSCLTLLPQLQNIHESNSCISLFSAATPTLPLASQPWSLPAAFLIPIPGAGDLQCAVLRHAPAHVDLYGVKVAGLWFGGGGRV